MQRSDQPKKPKAPKEPKPKPEPKTPKQVPKVEKAKRPMTEAERIEFCKNFSDRFKKGLTNED